MKPEPRVRTLFFGSSDFAVPSLRAVARETELIGVVTQPDRPSGRGHKLTPTPVKRMAAEFGVPIYEPASLKGFAREEAPNKCDLFVLASYGRILPADLLALPSSGALNVHPSLLPKYRGATPIQAALLGGDSETGVTIMLMDAAMDTGPILLQERTPVDPSENYGILHDRLSVMGAELLSRAITEVAAGAAMPHPQQGQPTITKPLTKQDLQIDWKWSARRIVNTVRAYSPAPAARAYIRGTAVKLLQVDEAPWARTSVAAGEVHLAVIADAQLMLVKCGDGSVVIEELIAPNHARESGFAFHHRLEALRR